MQDSYKYTNRYPIIGPGQGSKARSPTCSKIMFLLLMEMDVLAQRLSFYSHNKEITYSTKAIVFVDENTKYNNQFKV